VGSIFSQSGKRFSIDPLGSVPLDLCRDVGAFLEETFGPPFAVSNSRMPPVSTYNPLRGQYQAFRLLEFLEEDGPNEPFRRIGLTDLDLCTPVLTYVFGLARMGGRTCLVSTFRLKPEFHGLGPDEDTYRERVLKEVLHELGHTCGLKHCSVEACVMHFAHTAAHIDRRRLGYCTACRERAERVLSGEE